MSSFKIAHAFRLFQAFDGLLKKHIIDGAALFTFCLFYTNIDFFSSSVDFISL